MFEEISIKLQRGLRQHNNTSNISTYNVILQWVRAEVVALEKQ